MTVRLVREAMARAAEEWIEFDSVINIRPSRGNRSRGVEDPERRASIRELIMTLVPQ